MTGFLDSFLDEALARRRRIATTIGPRMQSLFDLLILGGVALGSGGLFLRYWMLPAAPWGLALPVIFVAGHLWLDWRRQNAPTSNLSKDEAEEARQRTDLYAVGFGVVCAVIGAFTFFYAWGQEPPGQYEPPAQAEEWTPPPDVLESEIAR